jgi:hypothetical protein
MSRLSHMSGEEGPGPGRLMETSPFMIMWDPQTYPQFNTIADIGKTDTKVLYFEGDTYRSSARGLWPSGRR